MTLKNKLFNLIALTSLILIFTSCSSYFSAGMSGKVTDKNTKESIENVLVCAYTTDATRDAAFNNYTYSYNNEFLGTDATFRTYTATNGSFSLKSIKWNTIKPEYGKDGDNITIYPLYFHKDYGLVKGNQFIITSDSINEGANQTLEKIREEKTIQIQVIHPTRETDYTNQYSFDVIEQKDASYTDNPDVQITKVENSNNQFKINYKKNSETPKLSITNIDYTNQIELKRNTQLCKNDTDLTFYTDDIQGITQDIETFNPNVSTYYLYAKPIRFTYPNIIGRITSADPDYNLATHVYGKDEDNNRKVWVTDEDDKLLGQEVYTGKTQTGDTSLIITNGNFTIDLSGETYIDKEYKGEYPTPKTVTLHYPTDKTEPITVDNKSRVIYLQPLTSSY